MTIAANADIERTYIPHLRTQFQQARPILFTGAGFSIAAKNLSGEALPEHHEIKERLWELCFPRAAFEDESTLPDLFDHAVRRHPKQLSSLLVRLLTVDAASLPPWYEHIFSFPWFRCYTLNIDDIVSATNRAFRLPRRVRQVSATNVRQNIANDIDPNVLEVIHLNGTLGDVPHHVTFSVTQYADRLSKSDPWYARFVTDILSHPVVFIGTRLDEPPLWQHLEFRGPRGNRNLGELRPRSYLVTPNLARARRALLAELNIHWIQMTGAQFTEDVLSRLFDARTHGLRFLRAKNHSTDHSRDVPDVADLAVNPTTENSRFLHGHEPNWADLQTGRAIHRDSDGQLWSGITSALRRKSSNLVVITGTAGSGKSTALMGACLKLTAEGKRVGWVDRDASLSAHDILRAVKNDKAARVLAIDDADRYGPSLASIVNDLLVARNNLLILLALRSTKIDKTLNPTILEGVSKQEVAMPPLTDSDIDDLLSVLNRYNRLGALKGKSLGERRQVLTNKCGRQLLVAMIEATSGRKFEEKAIQELTELESEATKIYALVAVAHAFRFPLQRDEILLAVGGGASNEILNIIRQLTRRHVITELDNGYIQARHRVIAEVIRDGLQEQGKIAWVITGLAFMAACKVNTTTRRSTRPRKMLRQFINHGYLLRSVGLEKTRNIYGQLESVLNEDFHYWLQRGSVEVKEKEGDLSLARQFLGQAHSMASGDPLVDTEWAYLLFREAIESPGTADAPMRVDEATSILKELISRHRVIDSYPYHVLGSQGLSWSRRGIESPGSKGLYLSALKTTVLTGIEKHPGDSLLKQLLKDIEREYLLIAVSRK